MPPKDVHLQVDLTPGHAPYERGRMLASALLTLAVNGERSLEENDEWLESTSREVVQLISEAMNTEDASAIVATVVHLSLAARRLCEGLAGAASGFPEGSEEPDPAAVNMTLQKMLASLEHEAIRREQES